MAETLITLPAETTARTVGDLPDAVSGVEALRELAETPIPEPLKDPPNAGDLEHRDLDDSDFWRRIPAFRDVTRAEFLDHRFQNRHSCRNVEQLADLLEGLAPSSFLRDVEHGMRLAPMAMRLSPYILSLIDWEEPYADPLRTQFIPVASTRRPDHPALTLDSLHEQQDSPTPGLVHRYRDKVLFLPLDVCPVYCRFCTRSYAIGTDTDQVDKVDYKPAVARWEKAFAYLASRPEVEDVVVSGGDTYMLPHQRVRHIGEMLLSIPHIRRIRFASKGPAVMPMKVLSDEAWTDTLVELAAEGRRRHKEVVLHTHFNSSREITAITRDAMNRLFERGVRVRNQSVLIRGVNDDVEEMIRLVRRLAHVNVQPYYVYQHDMVMGVDELRTTVGHTVEVERHVRGVTAGFNTPTFVCDAPGGGGKRDVHSYDHYDPVTGISVYRSPSVDEEKVYLYYDPLDLLPEEGRVRWGDPGQHAVMAEEALEAARLQRLEPAVSV
ncbi:MAG: KamA family radical SAM protein [Longimicrobiales bacterium]|nr:KamA family radical SAM protein [Longimicrobiales bacterium]